MTATQNEVTKPNQEDQTMKARTFMSAVALFFASVFAAYAGTPGKTIVDTAASSGSFNTLIAAIKAAGLTETLSGKGPFTVFAPTDEAFAKLPKETLDSLLKPENKAQLQSILTYHVVSGKVTAKEVAGLSSAATVNGKKVMISNSSGGVKVDNANVLKTDIMASNGVIHVIDTVMLPN